MIYKIIKKMQLADAIKCIKCINRLLTYYFSTLNIHFFLLLGKEQHLTPI